jgi:hypothetical protein
MDIKDKILQLRKFVPEGGANENESKTALAMALKLMEKHNIKEEDLLEVQRKSEFFHEIIICPTKTPSPGITLHGCMIEEFCDVMIWGSRNTSNGKAEVHVYGLEHDVKFAIFLLGLLDNSLTKEWRSYLALKQDLHVGKHTRYWSFRAGFASRIKEKIDELLAEQHAVSSQGKDLILMKKDIVQEGYKKDFPGLGLKEKNIRTYKVSPDVQAKGRASGSKVNSSRPLEK